MTFLEQARQINELLLELGKVIEAAKQEHEANGAREHIGKLELESLEKRQEELLTEYKEAAKAALREWGATLGLDELQSKILASNYIYMGFGRKKIAEELEISAYAVKKNMKVIAETMGVRDGIGVLYKCIDYITPSDSIKMLIEYRSS